ncbi:sugar transferase [Actinomyces bowdenii]|uniref:Sugar transferase n=1 Tax=Actinomyces bowdenii TaxID=131109 RepID=A0A853EMS9_9ACTO|nr:sugar transferase [Actinomyces bowdenii]MBF0698052.1 sugar transferase [Actinomyces bowdenii]NYS70225.1 sugar transferase [Actinomyces bowdenii]
MIAVRQSRSPQAPPGATARAGPGPSLRAETRKAGYVRTNEPLTGPIGLVDEAAQAVADEAATAPTAPPDRAGQDAEGTGEAQYTWTQPTSFYARYGKRAVDLTAATIALPVLGALSLGAGLAITLEDRGPVFFRQERWGRHGKPFKIVKLRSMSVGARDLRNADSSTVASRNDSRVTRVGRFLRRTSIDEVPQLINVLTGDMSLIGPRPNLATKPLERMGPLERRRLSVRPGITGYNQAFYRNSTTLQERYEADCYYVDHLTLALDLKILARTIRTVLTSEKLYTEDGR